MDIRFDEETKKGKSPTTRLYTQNQNGDAEDTGRADTERRRRDEPHIRVEKPEITPLGRIGLIISGFIFAGMVLFTLSGYERISRAYADINALNTEIEDTELRINELDVQIECAVTIQEAQQVAEAYGMQYPDNSQYIKIGDALPFSGSTVDTTDTTGTTDTTDTTGTTDTTDTTDTAGTTEPETSPEPDTTTTDDVTANGGDQPSSDG